MPHESVTERHQRYEHARGRMQNWHSMLRDAYQFTLPNRNDFDQVQERGQARNNKIYDSTAVEGVQLFASNMQTILMPPFKRWASLQTGDAIPVALKDHFQDELDDITEKLFKQFNASNIADAVNESLQELCIGTGVMMLYEGSQSKPLQFVSVPLSEIVLEEGPFGTLENFWRQWEIPARRVLREWPKAKLSSQLASRVKNAPDDKVKLIESCLYYPDQPEGRQYYYSVYGEDDRKEIASEWRDYTPLIAYRWARATREILGRGPVIQALSFIKVLNKLTELILRGGTLRSITPLLANSAGVLNPYNVKIEPGSIITVEPVAGGSALEPLDLGKEPQFAQLSVEQLQTQIKEMLFSNPLPQQVEAGNKSATEVSLMQQNWMRKNASAFGRLLRELLNPIIEKSLIILRRKGIIPDVVIDGKEIHIEYQSPIAKLQQQEDLQNGLAFVQTMTGLYGQEGLGAINNEEFPEWVAKQMEVPDEIVNQGWKTSPFVQNIMNLINHGPPQQQAEQIGQPATPQSQDELLADIGNLVPQPGTQQA